MGLCAGGFCDGDLALRAIAEIFGGCGRGFHDAALLASLNGWRRLEFGRERQARRPSLQFKPFRA
jgi:hypothetical protein